MDWLSDPRARPVLALLTAFCLYGFSHIRWKNAMNPLLRSIQYLSDVSYSIFVSHFAVIIVISGIWEKFDLEGIAMASLVIAIAWMASLAVGMVVQYLCDQSMMRMKSSH
jgi:peptidoglycan/LPS O-acetylase OafA/YrhL